MNKKTINFIGRITALQPITVTIKGCAGLPRNGGSADATPYLPATTIRGALRHASHWIAIDKQSHTGKRFDLAEHFLMAQGVDITGDVKSDADGAIDADQALRERNPMLSLWGLWGIASKAEIGPGLLLNPKAFGSFGGGARTIMFERTPELLETLDEEQIERLQNVLREQSEASQDISELKAKQAEIKRQLKKVSDKEEQSKLFNDLAELDRLIDQRKDEKSEARESIRRPLDQYEAFAPGAEFEHRMRLVQATDVELGLFLSSLAEFARNPSLGGHKAHGNGRIKAEWDVTIWERGADAPSKIGTVRFDENGIVIEGESLLQAREAFKAAILDFKKK